MEMCANVMGLPYYIGPQELAMMGLIDSRPITAAKLLWLLIDEPGLFDLIKKKVELANESTTSGNAA